MAVRNTSTDLYRVTRDRTRPERNDLGSGVGGKLLLASANVAAFETHKALEKDLQGPHSVELRKTMAKFDVVSRTSLVCGQVITLCKICTKMLSTLYRALAFAPHLTFIA